MQKLAKREAQLMQVLWRLKRAFVKEIIEELPDPKPHYNTVSTMVKILEEKGFVAHEKLGNAYRFYPVVEEAEYQKKAVDDVVRRYFDNSPMKLVNYFAKEQQIDAAELERLVQLIKDQDPRP
ncbi:putative transcriptional regulator [Neolewinella xylanilytica]|uniref:Putative transcriptional regulator n=1 Tax=Neolewinella xylanilytica TaxID=1514080 RepID=A0A2S6I717_9BACT|nr:BlaI/MecI/CopY family transcriptional regulator [Neolewinella xylanilytica]PPK87285.1 putative transcriptional regulator [Neolewinella xylanilytica]